MIFAGIPDVIGSPSLIYISNFNDPPQLENRFAWDRVRGSIMEDKLLGSSGGPPAKILSRPPLSPPPPGGGVSVFPNAFDRRPIISPLPFRAIAIFARFVLFS